MSAKTDRFSAIIASAGDHMSRLGKEVDYLRKENIFLKKQALIEGQANNLTIVAQGKEIAVLGLRVKELEAALRPFTADAFTSSEHFFTNRKLAREALSHEVSSRNEATS